MDLVLMKKIDEYLEYANNNGYILSKYATKIIGMVMANNGQCPCKRDSEDDQTCPCPDHKKEIETNGACTCNLFLKGE